MDARRSPEQYRPDESIGMFTQQELDVLFHVMNNSYGAAFERAFARAQEVDNMDRETFIKVYSHLISKLSNMEAL